ncbi:hypothetical protein M440DRAFT_1233188 [Trichoderma longibrachiatum ATCC 18648]|uniref:Uncharacterized protein n=1 Tax=Trichoderma longibrachiatum ATCC 18648 TaxID=983965 RepID=A0A2T4C5C5_TRILO|nr:hypothetical protein M440DRAFT_1233188 [Trichoderma longibrachiatum ATCC 18648]
MCIFWAASEAVERGALAQTAVAHFVTHQKLPPNPETPRFALLLKRYGRVLLKEIPIQMRYQCLLSSPTCRGGCVRCRFDHGEQAGGNSTWPLPAYRCMSCVSHVSCLSLVGCLSMSLLFPCCLMLLPGSHCRSCQCMSGLRSIQRDAVCRDVFCHENT